MTVKEGYEALKKLVDEGHGDVQFMAFTDQGDSAEGAVGDEVNEVTGKEDRDGEILDMKVGTKYDPLYFG